MKMLKELLGKELLFFDGAMGTLLQEQGLQAGEYPENWNISHPEQVIEIHRRYFAAGSNIVLTNTFGANRIKYENQEYSLREVVYQAVAHVKEGAEKGAAQGRKSFTGLDIGPTGQLLKPLGSLDFEAAYEVFKEVVRYGTEAGADLIHIETMSDTYEVKAAVLAAKENSDLPVTVTMMFDEKGNLLTGGDVASAVALLEGLRVDALGINCGLGPAQMQPLLIEIRRYTDLPVIVNPNAGLPQQRNGQTVYDVDPAEFAGAMAELVKAGAALVGGCCGTTPDHIKMMIGACRELPLLRPADRQRTVVSAYGKAVEIGSIPVIIGERINPTGKSKLKAALKEQNYDYVLKEGIKQQDAGAHILDVNTGLPDIDEAAVLREAVCQLQSITSLPLQIDTADIGAMEAAMRIYNGKPMVNSVNGKQESMDAVLPLIRKYGGVVVALTLDENGIPETAEGRYAIAARIVDEAAGYGIARKDVVADVLTMTVSSAAESAKVTLEALELVREGLGIQTVLGVSNISFGLPDRPVLNSAFYTMALQNGLSAGIINPLSVEMMASYYAYCALMEKDVNFEQYIRRYGQGAKAEAPPAQEQNMTLYAAIEKGLKEEAYRISGELLKEHQPLYIINTHLIPALDVVGKGFEAGTVFLPQLLMSAEAAKAAFEVLQENMSEHGQTEQAKEKVILATVKGDIHDIGKNIVKVLLENYGFEVLDLGKDVDPEMIVQTAVDQDVRLVGLSALMTTTVGSMETTIKLLRDSKPDCKVMVGGAVLNREYADMIGADFYGKDAMRSVYYAQKLLNDK